MLRPVLVGLFHWQLGLFELQELAPKKLKEKYTKKFKLASYILFFHSFKLCL